MIPEPRPSDGAPGRISLRDRIDAWAEKLNDQSLHPVARYLIGAGAAILVVYVGYFGAIVSPTRSVTYRASGRLPRLLLGDRAPYVVLVAPSRTDQRPRWMWFALVGWWAGFLWAFAAYVLLLGVVTIPAAMRAFSTLDAVLFLPRRREAATVVRNPVVDGGYERIPIPPSVRYRVLQRDGYRCRYCGRGATEDGVRLHIDHKVPVSRGGTNEMSNLVTSCQRCNLGKGTWVPEAERVAGGLRSEPYASSRQTSTP